MNPNDPLDTKLIEILNNFLIKSTHSDVYTNDQNTNLAITIQLLKREFALVYNRQVKEVQK